MDVICKALIWARASNTEQKLCSRYCRPNPLGPFPTNQSLLIPRYTKIYVFGQTSYVRLFRDSVPYSNQNTRIFRQLTGEKYFRIFISLIDIKNISNVRISRKLSICRPHNLYQCSHISKIIDKDLSGLSYYSFQ